MPLPLIFALSRNQQRETRNRLYCHPERSATGASRGIMPLPLIFALSRNQQRETRNRLYCHPERSAAKSRDHALDFQGSNFESFVPPSCPLCERLYEKRKTRN